MTKSFLDFFFLNNSYYGRLNSPYTLPYCYFSGLLLLFIRVVLSAINQLSPVQKHTASFKEKRQNHTFKGRNVLQQKCRSFNYQIFCMHQPVQNLLLETRVEKINKSTSVSSALLAYIYIYLIVTTTIQTRSYSSIEY